MLGLLDGDLRCVNWVQDQDLVYTNWYEDHNIKLKQGTFKVHNFELLVTVA